MDVNERRAPEKRICSFGKYAGYLYKDIPTNYLEWFVKNAYGQMVNRKRWAEQELDIRKKAKTV